MDLSTTTRYTQPLDEVTDAHIRAVVTVTNDNDTDAENVWLEPIAPLGYPYSAFELVDPFTVPAGETVEVPVVLHLTASVNEVPDPPEVTATGS